MSYRVPLSWQEEGDDGGGSLVRVYGNHWRRRRVTVVPFLSLSMRLSLRSRGETISSQLVSLSLSRQLSTSRFRSIGRAISFSLSMATS